MPVGSVSRHAVVGVSVAAVNGVVVVVVTVVVGKFEVTAGVS